MGGKAFVQLSSDEQEEAGIRQGASTRGQPLVRRLCACLGHPAGSKSYTLLYPPGWDKMAQGLKASLGESSCLAHCTSELGSGLEAGTAGMYWERFETHNPNFRLLISAIRDRDVVLLMGMESAEDELAQLQLVVYLQRFLVPHPLPEYAANKWKSSVDAGKFDVCSVASLTIVVPWYRYCQMERTCRWTVKEGKWYNGAAEGAYVDMPTAHSFATLLSAQSGGSCTERMWRRQVPKQIVFVDLHEPKEMERSLSTLGGWSNPVRAYNFASGEGTYFASAFAGFLTDTYASLIGDRDRTFVVFPDFGAHRRCHSLVCTRLGLSEEQVLHIAKSRVGAAIEQTDALFVVDASGTPQKRDQPLPAKSQVLIADDFTNSGAPRALTSA
jgi:hypothetical protein